MIFFKLIPLTASLVNLLVALFVLQRNWRASLNRVYFVWGLSIAIWNIGVFFMFHINSTREALFFARFLQFGVILLPVTLFHLCLLVAEISAPRILKVIYAVMGVFFIGNFTDFFISGVRYADNIGAYYAIGGTGFFIYTGIYFVLALVTVILLYYKQIRLPPLHRQRIRSLLLAVVLLFIFGTNDILPIIGIEKYPFTKIDVFPYGSAAAVFYGIIVGYSVLQYQLLNIRVTLSRFAAQLVRMLFMLLIGFSMLIILSAIVPHQFTSYAFFSALGVIAMTAFFASVFFPRFFGKGEEKLERRILGDWFEYHDKVRGFIQEIPIYTSSELLLDDLHELLTGTVKVKTYQIIFLDEKTRTYSNLRSFPEKAPEPIADLSLDSPVLKYFSITKVGYLAGKAGYSMPGNISLETNARKQIEQFDAEFCFPFYSGQDPFGLLLIGERAAGEYYTTHDLQLLDEMVKSLAIVLDQIRLKNQLLLAEEIELLGMMSRGMAHDLNNLLTPVWTYMQLATAGVNNLEMREELLPTATRNVETMRAYVNEALFLSRTQSQQLQMAHLDKIIQSVIELAQASLKQKALKIRVNSPAEVVAEVDEILIQRLISNLLSNAIHASRIGSEIEVKLIKLGKTESDRNWLRLLVIDRGEGISQDNLKRVASPYFTTKDRGDNVRGFGLGLAICRKIVHLHGGNFSIVSRKNAGTIVQVDLPNRQLNKPSSAGSVAS